MENLKIKFNKDKRFTINNNLLSKGMKNNLKKIFNQIGIFFSSIMDKKDYSRNMIFLIENIMDNFFMINNKVNTNHIFISKNYNSILVKIIPKYENDNIEKKEISKIN